MPIYPVGGNKGDAFSRTNGSRCRYTRGSGRRETKKRKKNSKRERETDREKERDEFATQPFADRLSQYG